MSYESVPCASQAIRSLYTFAHLTCDLNIYPDLISKGHRHASGQTSSRCGWSWPHIRPVAMPTCIVSISEISEAVSVRSWQESVRGCDAVSSLMLRLFLTSCRQIPWPIPGGVGTYLVSLDVSLRMLRGTSQY